MILGVRKFRDSERKIFFELGDVNLKEFAIERAKLKIKFWKD